MDRTFMRVVSLFVLGMTLLFADFVAKAYVYNVLPFFEMCAGTCKHIPVFYNFAGIDFMISPAINRGAAWGFFANFQMVLLVIRVLVIFGILVYLFFMNHNRKLDLPLVLICAGAIGNVVDFFLYGFVVDFLHFNLWGYHFPIFNFADCCITIGVTWLFLANLFKSKKSDARARI